MRKKCLMVVRVSMFKPKKITPMVNPCGPFISGDENIRRNVHFSMNYDHESDI